MLDTLFLTVNQWMTAGIFIGAAGCFVWGMISVMLSPCHMASIPLIVAYVGGQQQTLEPRQASGYSIAFTMGLFITITLVGFICTFLGRMLGDIGSYWQILIGSILIFVALGMLGVEKCSMSGSLLYRLNVKGLSGAFILGLLYGLLPGSCTFGFIAPILAIITVQEKIMTGMVFILLFATGHCLPIMIAGSSTAAVRKLIENRSWQGTGVWFRKGAGIIVLLLGFYFIINPFMTV
ncbi:cytochrome c biogenesis CcdA family protein [Desulfobacula sp.]